jgi:hypothetical protein
MLLAIASRSRAGHAIPFYRFLAGMDSTGQERMRFLNRGPPSLMSAEPPSSSGLPGRNRPALSDLSKETTEGDLWNLDDELAERSAPRVTHPPMPRQPAEAAAPQERAAARGKTPAQDRPNPGDPLARKVERPVAADEIGDLIDDGDEPATAAVRIIPEEEPRSAPEPPARGITAAPEQAPRERAEAPQAKESPPRVAADSQRPASRALPRPRLKRREILGLAAFAFSLLLAAIWVLSRFFSSFEFKSEFVQGPDFPVKGEHAALAGAETYWRPPVREGDARDFARREVKMIPVLEVTLDPDGSPDGALLVIFRNGEGKPVGDSIRRSFSGGRFDSSGDATISFPATDGFAAQGDFNAYRTGKGESWMAEILEGPSVDAPAGSFKLLAPIPVLPKLR